MSGKKKILAISVHPDDETLGCGGTLLKHRDAGDELFWVIATVAFEPQWSAETIAKRAAEVECVAQAYGAQEFFKLGLPTTRLDEIPLGTMMESIRGIIAKVRPDTVYLVHEHDVHTDHGVIFRATMSVLKAFYMKKLGVQRVLSYETLSSTEAAAPHFTRAFVPTVFSDITPYIERKIEIMAMYESEVQPDPLPRGPSAIRALARYRGATVGVEAAEAFLLLREVL